MYCITTLPLNATFFDRPRVVASEFFSARRGDDKGDIMDYSVKVKRLEEILEKMEGASLPLEETLALYDEGQKLVKECREFLAKAETRVKKLEEDGTLSDFGDVREEGSAE